MGTPYLSEIRVFGFGFAPKNWAMCQGQLLPINSYQALFALLGTTYGGNGTSNFALPDMRSRVVVSPGTDPAGVTYALGQRGGEENHTLVVAEMPAHLHPLNASNNPTGSGPTPSSSTALGVSSGPVGAAGPLAVYGVGATAASLASNTISNNGSSQAHANLMPYLAMNYCISMSGIFPSRN